MKNQKIEEDELDEEEDLEDDEDLDELDEAPKAPAKVAQLPKRMPQAASPQKKQSKEKRFALAEQIVKSGGYDIVDTATNEVIASGITGEYAKVFNYIINKLNDIELGIGNV